MLEGRLLNERYKIKKMIGGGGMANVYLARDIILDRDVAIKVLRLEYANDEEFIARFHREAQSATSLSHPNVVNIYDVGDEENIYYMVMEYVDGMTLKKYIQTYGPVEVEEAIDIMKQITSAISHAHANDIVHRDIKPQNILIDPYGHVKVTDFGIAVALSATSLTQTNSVLGSVHYLSPEQARGGMANKKSDIYSLGIVLFELLTGRLPFSGESAVSIALKHLQSNTPSIRRWNPDLPQSIENIVLKATTKDPFHRYDAVFEMEDALDAALLPGKIDEEMYIPPEDSGEATKAIPVITHDTFKQHKSSQDTIVNSTTNNQTIPPEEEKPVKKKKKRKKAVVWVTIILVSLLTAIVAALFILPSMLQPKDVTIPDVEGMEYEEAVRKLTALNLVVVNEEMYSEDIEEGYVIKTEPVANEVVKEGREVTIFSSQGKEKVTFGDYVGRNFAEVERELGILGYQDIDTHETHSDRPAGEIIKQILPDPEAMVVPEDTRVFFEVSIGPEKITLNRLVGLTGEEATEYLDNQNLSVRITEENSDEIEEGRVISQTPEANSEVKEKTEVHIVVSKGPKEKPPLTHSVSVSIPYTAAEQDTNNEETEQSLEQEVLIYVDDADHKLTDLFDQVKITKDIEYKIPLTIRPNEEATYKVVVDGDAIIQEKISYADIEGE